MSVFECLTRTGFFPLCYEGNFGKSCSDESNSPGFQFLFAKHNSHLSLYSRIPRDLVLMGMNRMTKPFFGEFVETTDSTEFLAIRAQFFYGMFGNNELGVSFEDFNSLLDRLSLPPDEQEKVEEIKKNFQFPEGNSLQLGYRGSLNKKGNGTFVHIETGLEIERPNGKEELIPCSGDGLPEQDRFKDGFIFTHEMIIDRENIKLLKHLCTKRMRVSIMQEVDVATEELIKSIYNGNPFFFDKKENFSVSSTPEIMGPAELKDYILSVSLLGDRDLSELGRVANTNPKMERLTTGENYKDIVAVANRQRMTLDQLKLFAHRAEERGGIQLAFAINGIPQRQPMEGDSESPQGMESQGVQTIGESSGRF